MLVALQAPIHFLALHFVQSSAAVKGYAGTYFDVRIWSAPAAFANYTILGWLLGTGRTGMALGLQVVLTASISCSRSCSFWFSAGAFPASPRPP